MTNELTGKAKELAEEYEVIYARCVNHRFSDEDYERICEIENEMDDLGYIQDKNRKWVATKEL